MDNYRIESHKLMYHPERLSLWSKGIDIYPIYVEIAPAGSCNHRCIFCALDYLEYKPSFLNTKYIKKFISDISKKGIKSVMFAGEGEPLLHKDLPKIIKYTKEKNIDAAITTNGVLLNKKILGDILKYLSWLRISINAGTPKTYALIHRTRPQDFNLVIKNLKEAVKIKRRHKYNCTIGAQFLLLSQNYKEAENLARALRKIGLDYLIIKPYSQHPFSKNRLKETVDYRSLLKLEKKLEKLESRDFKIIFRKHTMEKLSQDKPYRKCLGLPFWSYLTSEGELYSCSAFLGDNRFCYGSIYQDSFEKIWKGQKRKKAMRMMAHRWDIKNCREVCRLDEINRYLWELAHPPAHVNFI